MFHNLFLFCSSTYLTPLDSTRFPLFSIPIIEYHLNVHGAVIATCLNIWDVICLQCKHYTTMAIDCCSVNRFLSGSGTTVLVCVQPFPLLPNISVSAWLKEGLWEFCVAKQAPQRCTAGQNHCISKRHFIVMLCLYKYQHTVLLFFVFLIAMHF